jgi:hypothetical protein
MGIVGSNVAVILGVANMFIQVKVRSVYGNDTVYPLCEKAKLFADIAGTKTLTPHTLMLIERMGYTIQGMDLHK